MFGECRAAPFASPASQDTAVLLDENVSWIGKTRSCKVRLMPLARRILAIWLASLVAWFGVAAAAPLHSHPMDESQPLFQHLAADDAHSAHGGHAVIDTHPLHEHAPSDDGVPSGGSDHEPILHSHGCSHAATVSELVWTPVVSLVATAAWREADETLRSLLLSPPRKPPRASL
jgi:hypothetical protein